MRKNYLCVIVMTDVINATDATSVTGAISATDVTGVINAVSADF